MLYKYVRGGFVDELDNLQLRMLKKLKRRKDYYEIHPDSDLFPLLNKYVDAEILYYDSCNQAIRGNKYKINKEGRRQLRLYADAKYKWWITWTVEAIIAVFAIAAFIVSLLALCQANQANALYLCQ
jgi:hypothetical protein